MPRGRGQANKENIAPVLGQGAQWQPWEDRALALAVEGFRPYHAKRQELAGIWEQIAKDVAKAYQGRGEYEPRTGRSAKERFTELLKIRKAEDLESLQKTGTNEEVSEFIGRMTGLVELVESVTQAKVDVLNEKRRIEENKLRGTVLREAMTERRSNRTALRERSSAYISSQSDSSPSITSKRAATPIEWPESPPRPAKRRHTGLVSELRDMAKQLEEDRHGDAERLAELSKLRRAEELRAEAMQEAMVKLTEVIKEQGKMLRQSQEMANARHEQQLHAILALAQMHSVRPQ